MRTKSLKELYINFTRPSPTKVVEKYRAQYEVISDALEKNTDATSLAHRHWTRMLSVSSCGGGAGTHRRRSYERSL